MSATRQVKYLWERTRPGGEYRITECVRSGAVTITYNKRSFTLPTLAGRTLAHAKTEKDAELICKLMNRGRR